jgi:hypothetical protein
MVLPAVLAAVVLVAGCTAETPEPPVVSACPTAPPTETDVVTPERLCEIDGRAWRASSFTFVLNVPEWRGLTPECDVARQDAYWTAWKATQPAIVTLDLASGFDEDSADLGSVGVAVIDDENATATVASIDAELDACVTEASGQTRIDHGDWHGLRGPTSEDGDVRSTWWVAVDDSWALVQARSSNGATAAELDEFDAALPTLLDAQLDLLEGP